MRLAGAGRAREILPKNSRSTFLSIIEPNKLRRFGPRRSLPFNLAWRKSRNGGSNRRSWASRVRIGLTAGAKEIRTAGPILVFIDRGGRFETNTDGTAPVDVGAFAGDPPHDPRGSISPPSVPP